MLPLPVNLYIVPVTVGEPVVDAAAMPASMMTIPLPPALPLGSELL
jgi:hypothetical protein